MLSQKRLVYALVRDGVYDLLGQIDVAWITDPNIQKMVGAVAESLSVNGSAKLPDVINTLEASSLPRIQKDIHIANLKAIVSTPTVWTPELPEQLLADYRDFHREEVVKVLSDELSTVEQRLKKVEELRTALIGVSEKDADIVHDLAEAHLNKIESGELTMMTKRSIKLQDINLQLMFSQGRIFPVPIIIAGREGFSKTQVLTNVILDISTERPGLLYSLEDTGETFSTKFMATKSQMDYARLMMGELGKDEIAQLRKDNESGQSKNVTVLEKMFTIDEWERDLRKRILTSRVDWVAIDFLQSFRGMGRGMSEIAVSISRATKIMRQITKEYLIPIICLSQVNDNSEEDGEVRLHIGNLKGSGSIKEDARQVFVLDGVRNSDTRRWSCVKNSGFGRTYEKEIRLHMPAGKIMAVYEIAPQ